MVCFTTLIVDATQYQITVYHKIRINFLKGNFNFHASMHQMSKWPLSTHLSYNHVD